MKIPQELKTAIENQIIGIKSNKIVENAQQISNRYRNNEGRGNRMLTNKDEALSYAISRMPSTYCAIYSTIQQALKNFNDPITTCLDVGAGTEAATWAIKQLINKDGVPFEVVNPRPSKELLEALQEGEDILNGKVKAKSYTNMYEMLKDLKD